MSPSIHLYYESTGWLECKPIMDIAPTGFVWVWGIDFHDHGNALVARVARWGFFVRARRKGESAAADPITADTKCPS